MERSLLLGLLALGLTGWLAGLLLSRATARTGVRAGGRGFAIGLIIIVAAAAKAAGARTMWPAAYPWDLGIVVGGVAALLGAWVLDRLHGAAGPTRGAVAAAPMFLAVAANAAAALWLRSGHVETLLGVGFGWAAIALVLHAEALAHPQADATGAVAALLPNLGFALTLPAAVVLGTFRDAAAQATTWSLAPILLAVGVPLCLALAGALVSPKRGPVSSARTRRGGATNIIAGFSATLALGGLAALIGLNVLGQPRFPIAVAVGLAMSLMLWWLCAETAGQSSREAASGLPSGPHVLGVVAALGGIIASFYVLIGYGVGLALLAAWLPAALALVHARREDGARPGDGAPPEDGADYRTVVRISLLLMLGVVILLYRVFVQRFDADLTGASLTDHFAIFTFVAGLFVPGLLAQLLTASSPGARHPELRLAAVFGLMALVPATALALWGSRAAIGLLAGFAASTVLYPAAPAAAAVAVATSLLLAQWGHHAIVAASLTRDDRVKVVIALAALTAIVLVVSDVWTRWMRRSTADPSEAETLTEGVQS